MAGTTRRLDISPVRADDIPIDPAGTELREFRLAAKEASRAGARTEVHGPDGAVLAVIVPAPAAGAGWRELSWRPDSGGHVAEGQREAYLLTFIGGHGVLAKWRHRQAPIPPAWAARDALASRVGIPPGTDPADVRLAAEAYENGCSSWYQACEPAVSLAGAATVTRAARAAAEGVS